MKITLNWIDARRTGLSILMVIMLAIPAGAETMYRLDVTYTNGSILSGPLSFGLSTLPTSVSATFILGPGQVVTPEPGEPEVVYFDEADALFGRIAFGNAIWTENDLEEFEMFFDDTVNDLTYGFLPITTQVVDGGIALNFPLTVTGMDIASGMPFEYQYTESTQTLTELPIAAVIDIKPGSYPNSINLGSYGLIPVAILSSDVFDATTVDPETVELSGAGVGVRGKSNNYMAHEKDVNKDGFIDLVVQVATANLDPTFFQDGHAVLTGYTFRGEGFVGTDEVRIVPPEEW